VCVSHKGVAHEFLLVEYNYKMGFFTHECQFSCKSLWSFGSRVCASPSFFMVCRGLILFVGWAAMVDVITWISAMFAFFWYVNVGVSVVEEVLCVTKCVSVTGVRACLPPESQIWR